MKTYQRRQEIFQFIFDKKTVKISELKEVFQVSEVTIRSDLDFLESEEKIERLHGGAAIIDKSPQVESVLPSTPLLDAKISITKRAAELIVPGDTIFLDSSATCIVLASHLNPELNITVITNSLPIINLLKQAPGIRLYAIPGLYNPSTNSFNGPLGETFISNLKTSKAFISPKGIIVEGLRDLTADEAAIRKAMINSTREPIIVVDHSKFNHSEILFQISDFSPISTVVTDKTPAPLFVDILQTRKITLITTESGS
ncbi:DeoR/GlpR family DNA-binding transcription regulator [Paenibacillus mendelii]|uniref:DeoR/GlpR family DNA-binding transcription regulator n=1 Tax=Paenibacillus mendelii TaxID=206163 RepID=A0ABV6JLX1_9BACL|nr:DeoR/GlpR family DNA-binding transcription regulator [Paenibacillus mendelii]MCQ6560618.1 DeoR/GlpR family DNA-binding transcription regulator [Paenibacillus mendelii]